MMGRTPWATEIHDTPQKSPRNPGPPPTYIVIHHAASQSFDAVVQMEMGTKQVSSTVVVKDNRVASMFDEWPYRAWSLSSGYWDSVSLSSETCNNSGAPGWTISESSYLTLARLVADWCRRYGIPCNRNRVIGHREVYTRFGASYATACPGGIDLDRVVNEANAILGSTPAGGGTPLPTIDRSQTVETVRRASTGDIFNITWEGIKHLNTSAQASISAAVQYQDDTWHNLTDPQLFELIDAYAIPRNKVYGLPGNSLPVGYVWSAVAEARSQNNQILAAIAALGS